jgi:hypothetical protein
MLGILFIPQFGQCASDEPRQLDAHLAHVFHNGEALIGDKEKAVAVRYTPAALPVIRSSCAARMTIRKTAPFFIRPSKPVEDFSVSKCRANTSDVVHDDEDEPRLRLDHE